MEDIPSKQKGLGDVVESSVKFLSLDRIAKIVANMVGQEDCGCEERKEFLNKIRL